MILITWKEIIPLMLVGTGRLFIDILVVSWLRVLMQLLRHAPELLSGAGDLHPLLTLAKKIFKLWTPVISMCTLALA